MADTFLLDTNCFIESAQRWHPFSVFPGFWDGLLMQNQARSLFTILNVVDEIHDDEVTNWLKQNPTFILPLEPQVLNAYKSLVNWVDNQKQFDATEKNEFYTKADGWLVAYASAYQMSVVSQEERAKTGSHRIKIPNLCDEMGVEFINFPKLIKQMDFQLVLQK